MTRPDLDPDYEAFFRRYAEAYTASLGGDVQVDAIRRCFAETSLALSEDGGVQPAANEDLPPLLERMYAFYSRIGTQRLTLERVEASAIAPGHDRVEAFYRGHYRTADRETAIPFSVTYLLQRRPDGPKIFAFIAGDEQALMRRHGLIDQNGEPVG